jgi:1-acyl-sn-glycerol-3-phosphate acyltransferase
MNKNINTKCICENDINNLMDTIIILYPCSHLCHINCLHNSSKCYICNEKIDYVIPESQLEQLKFKNKEYYQMWIDLLSIKITDNKITTENYINFSTRIPTILNIIYNVYKEPLTSKENIETTVDLILNMANIKLTINNKNLDKDIKKIYVVNHSNYLDSIICVKALQCGFVGSSIIKELSFLNKFIETYPCLVINRGSTNNSVKQMKEFIDINKKLFIFPEGLITHNKTLGQFRTGAFATGYPVQPVIIKYDIPINTSIDIKKCLFDIFSHTEINVTLTFLPIIENNNNINPTNLANYTRLMMAKHSNLYLSRISNRYIKD